MVIVPVTEDVCDVGDSVTLAVRYRLITQKILSTIDYDAVLVIVMDDLTVTSAVGVGLLRHGRNPYSDLTHPLSPPVFLQEM